VNWMSRNYNVKAAVSRHEEQGVRVRGDGSRFLVNAPSGAEILHGYLLHANC